MRLPFLKARREEPPQREWKLPEGNCIYAIGDVHGRADLLADAFERIDRHRSINPNVAAAEILIGDLLDRGPDTRGCVEVLLKRQDRFGTVLIQGNHEHMFRNALEDQDSCRLWLANGGRETLLSYGYDITGETGRPDIELIQARIPEIVPEEHLLTLVHLPPIAQIDDFVFVHAGLRPGKAIEEQSIDDMLWIREPFLSTDYDFGALVVHGHTPVQQPQRRANRVNIDTGAYLTGRLTCLLITDRGVSFL